MERHKKCVNSLSRDRGGHSTRDLRSPSRRRANVYDAVAGRIAQNGFIGKSSDSKVSTQPLRPDEVLFKQAKAPVRYEETDYYHAHVATAVQQQLPGGDILSAIHAYVSSLYSHNAQLGNEPTWKCMDETALIALGILLEETAREVLGSTGDLAFTEPANMEKDAIVKGAFGDVPAASTRRDAPVDDSTNSVQSDSSSLDSESDYTTDEST
ncbi:hypothetical protein IAQ61_001759 [Plenodomus lingam]|uniref:Uncharacterized protein n=1 Tax=Leptosphaeria maculans (strain JN3 / isolate v23.1.3 / race Av1-4-5-6-7-8) TaxID=985895 RepID=E4ZG49_LEPMJ|nr:hypothetical protein LEMA_P063950.1 [Plenodomus lingam JN3]KAH9878487.1 hypothetical protein IAQ61_001759 [Plenodomus lingam]CBX90269.1 hypothetical protein LEMA_P063950.1 [Plenodomus lingam JN3]